MSEIPRLETRAGASLPLSLQQVGYLAMERAGMARYLPEDGRPSTANLHIAQWIHGPFSVESLELTLRALLARHEALRTRLAVVDDALVQTFEPVGPPAIDVFDLTGEAGDRDALVRAPAIDAILAPFDYFSGPMVRTRVVKVADEVHAVVLVVPHIVSDAWSVYVLADEFRTIYESVASNRPASLPERTFFFGDFLDWQRASLREKAALVERCYERTAACASWSFAGESRVDGQGPSAHTTDVLSFELGAALSSALPVVSRQRGVSEFIVLLAALNMALVEHTRGETPLVHALFSGRTHAPAARIVGLLSNLCAIPTDMKGAIEPAEVLRRVRRSVLETQAVQWIPREALNELARHRGQALPSRSVVLNYLVPPAEAPSAEESPSSERRWRLFFVEIPPHVATRLASFDVGLWITRSLQGGLRVRVFYRRGTFDANRIAAFGSRFMEMTERIVGRSD